MKAKPSGGWRPIQRFEIGHRTAQQVARPLLAAHAAPRPWQYDFKGVDKAIDAVINGIVAGRPVMAHIDIKSFYAAFDRKELAKALSLPTSLTNNFLAGEFLNAQTKQQFGLGKSTIQDLLSEARKGVPQGSSASPLIGVSTISSMNWQPSPDVMPVTYGDNLALMCATEAMANADTKALCAAIEALPTGNFHPKIVSVGHVADGVGFLGVQIKLAKALTIHPTSKNLDNFFWTLKKRRDQARKAVVVAKKYGDAFDIVAARTAVARMWCYASGWLSAFRACTNIVDYHDLAEDFLNELLGELDCSPDDLKPFMTGSHEWADHVTG